MIDCRLSRARRNVESEILSNKQKIFHKPINGNLNLQIIQVKTCCTFHNYVRTRDGLNFEDMMTVEGLFEIEPNSLESLKVSNLLIQARNKLA